MDEFVAIAISLILAVAVFIGIAGSSNSVFSRDIEMGRTSITNLNEKF